MKKIKEKILCIVSQKMRVVLDPADWHNGMDVQGTARKKRDIPRKDGQNKAGKEETLIE